MIPGRAWVARIQKSRGGPRVPRVRVRILARVRAGTRRRTTESFLCQPLTFVSCSWSDELCDQRSTRDATRRATKAPAADDHLTKNVALRLTEPSVPTYLGLKAANAAGTTAPPRVRRDRAHRPRRGGGVRGGGDGDARRRRRAGARRRAAGGGAAQARALPRRLARRPSCSGRRIRRRTRRRTSRDRRRRGGGAARNAGAAQARLSPESTPPRASASKPPLPPKDRTPPRRPTADVGGDRKEKQAPPAPPVLAEDAAGSAVVEPGEGAESVDMNSDDEIDAWLAD